MKKNVFVMSLALLSTLGIGMALQARFSDIPRDFWAEGAVNRMVAEGIVSGYPDGTFRGGNNVNRYEVSSMFDRLLLSRRFTGLETSVRANSTELVNLRAADIRVEESLRALQTEIAALKANSNQTLNIDDRFDLLEKKAAEQQELIAQLRSELETQKSQTSLIVRLSEQNTALNARVLQLEQQASTTKSNAENIAALQNQVAVLSTRLAQLEQRPALPQTDTTALNARIVALEAQTARIPALEAQAAKVATLENQVARIPALEAQIGALNTSVVNVQRALAERPSTPAPVIPPVTPSQPNQPTSPATQQAQTQTAALASTVAPLSVALGVSSNLLPNANYNAPLGVGLLAQVGLNLSDSFGVRFGLDLSEIPSFGVDAILGLGNGFYAGAGGGLVVAGGGAYLGVVIGFSFDLAQNFALFLEANPRLNFSTGFGIKTALGVRIGL